MHDNENSSAKIKLKSVHPGQYYHFGIQHHFNDKNYAFLQPACKNVNIDIGIDGAKIFTASKITIWPIIGAFVDRPNVRPFLIGCYTGKHQPANVNDFLKDLCDETTLLGKKVLTSTKIQKNCLWPSVVLVVMHRHVPFYPA